MQLYKSDIRFVGETLFEFIDSIDTLWHQINHFLIKLSKPQVGFMMLALIITKHFVLYFFNIDKLLRAEFECLQL